MPRDLTEYEDAIRDALAVTNQAFPMGTVGQEVSELRVACFTVTLADMLAQTRT
jgi:hypothetical protein